MSKQECIKRIMEYTGFDFEYLSKRYDEMTSEGKDDEYIIEYFIDCWYETGTWY